MGTTTMKCPTCKEIVNIDQKVDSCQHCSTKIKRKPSKLGQVTANPDFHEKLAVAKEKETHYREGQLSFNQVLKVYDGVGLIGSHYWEYWYERANFFAESGFLEAESGQSRNEARDKGEYKVLASRKAFLETYALWMDQAMSCKGAEVDALKQEKEEKLRELTMKLETLAEFSPNSYKGLMDRPPTGWESLSGYLIGLCLIAAVVLVIMSSLG